MSNLDRRKLLHAGMALAIPLGGISALSACPLPTPAESEDKTEQEGNSKTMQIQYLEIVTPKADALCKQYSAVHGITFSDPIPAFGNARTADLEGGGVLAIRGPLRETETPVVRPYTQVKDLAEAVAAAKRAGAEVAIESMELAGQGSIAIVILGGIECGFWQVAK